MSIVSSKWQLIPGIANLNFSEGVFQNTRTTPY